MDDEKLFHEHGVLAVRFSDVLERAKAGDTLAARNALETIVFVLSEHNSHSVTGKRWPVQDSIRDYLATALQAMLDGKNGDQAFHLKSKGGSRAWGHFEKRLAADQVFQLVKQGIPVDKAAAGAEEIISKHLSSKPGPAWRGFAGRTVKAETLMTWYYELRDELEDIHDRAGDL